MLHVFCDFDGTITEPDTLCFLTERLGAGPEHYRETGRLLRAGALSLREAVARDIGTIRTPFAEAAALLRAHVTVDAGFAPFARWCAACAPTASAPGRGSAASETTRPTGTTRRPRCGPPARRAAARSWSATASRTASPPPSP